MNAPALSSPGQDPDARAVASIRRRLLRWGKLNYRDFPWRETSDTFLGLIAEVLLQRTRAANVVPVYYRFSERFPTPRHLAEAEEAEIVELIWPLGLRWRAPLLKALGAHVSEAGVIPDSIEEPKTIPGVGSYVAAAYLSFHGGGRGVLIDSNVVRWLARLSGRPFDAETRRRRWVRDLMERITPERQVKAFNYALLDFTMTICTPGIPRCPECPLGPELCEFGQDRLGKLQDTAFARQG